MFTRRWKLNAVDSNPNSEPTETLLTVVTAKESLTPWVTRRWIALIEHVWIRLVVPVLVTVIAGFVLGRVFRRREPRQESG